ncbi:MAG: heptaprenyl diphosphate synthase [Syntrophomonadaceae bacterium]|jgi:heptaprenyl diphosphate synthase|nr:heptaprenyl diphosphate synthase [Syntrophomonadaceae bacterium]
MSPVASSFDFFKDIQEELQIVEAELTRTIDTDLEVLQESSTHLIRAGGKRLRPAFALLSGSFYASMLSTVIPMAVALELVHMATLVHDDVIDNSTTRRGRETVKARWGNRISVYAGNYIFARSLDIIAGYRRTDVVNILADASMKICEGEIIQLASCYDTDQGLKDYLRRIERKTALLMSMSCHMGALISNAPPEQVKALSRFGYYLGMAFQITDDILDYVADEEVLGKPIGSDIRQGIITLPALYALHYGADREKLVAWLSSPEACQERALQIIDMVIESGGIDYAYTIACSYVDKARAKLVQLPDASAKRTLGEIADFIADRNF